MSAAKREAEFGWPGGDRPGQLQFIHPASPELHAALQDLLRPELGALASVHALTPPAGAVGRFSVSTTAGAEWFIRVSARWGHPALEQAITGCLQAGGCAVNHLTLAGLRLEWQGQSLRVDARHRLRGRHFDGSFTDLENLARALAQCHHLLRAFPRAAAVRELAAQRFATLHATRERMRAELARGHFAFFCHDPHWAESRAAWLTLLVENFDPRWDLLPSSQCLHAQIHQANVLFTPAPVLVDWEEAVQTFAPVQWDLAYFIQRFCLHGDPPPPLLRARLQAVRAAYSAPLGDLAAAMRHVAWFSAVILVGYHQAQVSNPISEYEKFVRLEEQARHLRPILEAFSA